MRMAEAILKITVDTKEATEKIDQLIEKTKELQKIAPPYWTDGLVLIAIGIAFVFGFAIGWMVKI